MVQNKLLNQTEWAKRHGIKRQRAAQLILEGNLLTQIVGKRRMIIDCLYNDNVVTDYCQGSGNWNRPRSRY